MQWLMRFRALWGAHTSYQGFRPTPQHPCRQSSSAPGAPRWNDHDTPKEFNFASDVVDYWTQMEKHIGHVWPINYSLNGSDCTWHAGQQHDQHKEGKRGPSPALWWVNNEGDEVKWSFTEVTDLTRRAANVLTQSCGLQEGDRLALILPRVPEWWLVVLGCIRSGIIFIPGTTQLKASDILYRLNTSKAKSIVTTDALAPEVDSVASQCPALKIKLLVSDHSREGWLDFRSLVNSAAPDHTCVKSKTMDPMTIFFTSGTTGFPKMAKHSHGLALRSSFPSWKLMQLKTRDVLWCLSDPGWLVAVVGSLFEPWTAGCTVFSHHLPRFDPKIVTQTFFKYPITQCVAVPLIFQMILQQNPTRKLQTKEQDTSKETGPLSITPASVCARGGDRAERFPTLEHCCTVGDFLLPEDQEKWRQQTGLVLHPAYGQSETGIACGNSPGMKVKPGSVGKTIPPFDIQIIDSEGNILPPNTEGNIGIRIKPTRPIGLFMGFENDPEKTAKVECGDFHDTGDIATMDEEGYIWFLGRECDFIKASGYRIGPAEVENALAEHPAVAESAVVSSPDPIRGQVVKAFIVLTPQFLSRDRDQLAKELQQHVKSVTAPYKYPRKVEFVPELPKTITGKIKRSELQKKEFGQT